LSEPARTPPPENAIDFEDLFETAPCGYLAADKDGRISRANRTFASWLGCEPAALAGRRFSDLLSVGGRIFYETHFAPMLRMQGQFSEVALDIVAAGGRRIPVLVNAVERRDAQGLPAFIRFTIFVAAERRSYERGLLEARNAAEATVLVQREDAELREQFIAVLGHDLRNPLASIASGVRMLEKEALSDRGAMVLRLMNGSVVRAAGLIDNVLDFARGRLGGGITLSRNAAEPLEPVLHQVVAELRSIAPDQVVVATFAIDEPVHCDRVRIGQLLSNLLGNALTHGARDQPVRVLAETTAGELVISVANSGPAIPLAALDRLFQPFYRGDDRVRKQGLGLGLHIASAIATAHGGTLTVRSNAIETCFTCTVPLKPSDGEGV
jgi:sigma-B regulation protein RsbU (phosphoserine phosphatase)